MTTRTGFTSQRILIVGGSSGMGFALAEKMLGLAAEVTIVGRSSDKLAAARDRLANPDRLRTIAADVTKEEEVVRLFSSAQTLDHIVTTAADITARTLSVSATGVNKAYDGTTSATVTLSDRRFNTAAEAWATPAVKGTITRSLTGFHATRNAKPARRTTNRTRKRIERRRAALFGSPAWAGGFGLTAAPRPERRACA